MDQETQNMKKPIDYVRIFFRRKWLVIIPAVLGLIGGIIASNMLPKVYEASTLILVEEGRVLNPLIEGLAVSTSVSQRLGTLREQILGWDRINQLITTLKLAKMVNSTADFEQLVARLRSEIKVRLRGPNIIGISYQGENPQEAMDIVKTITDIFIAENLKTQNSETDNAIAFINDQLALYQKKLKQSEISEMEDKLRTLMLDSTEKHPLVIELKKKIDDAKAQLEGGDYTIDQTIATQNEEMKALREELKGIKDELTTSSLDKDKGGENRSKIANATNEKLYKMLLLERIDKVSEKDVGVNQKLYNELLQRLETAKLTQRLEASKEGTKYIILDPARLPYKPVKPNKAMVLMMGAFAGMCVGVGLVLLLELFDHSFIDVNAAKQFLELPMLGAISKIITEKDMRAQRIRNIKIAAMSILTGAILTVVIIFNVILGK